MGQPFFGPWPGETAQLWRSGLKRCFVHHGMNGPPSPSGVGCGNRGSTLGARGRAPTTAADLPLAPAAQPSRACPRRERSTLLLLRLGREGARRRRAAVVREHGGHPSMINCANHLSQRSLPMLDYTKILVECVCAGHVLGLTSVVKQASRTRTPRPSCGSAAPPPSSESHFSATAGTSSRPRSSSSGAWCPCGRRRFER